MPNPTSKPRTHTRNFSHTRPTQPPTQQHPQYSPKQIQPPNTPNQLRQFTSPSSQQYKPLSNRTYHKQQLRTRIGSSPQPTSQNNSRRNTTKSEQSRHHRPSNTITEYLKNNSVSRRPNPSSRSQYNTKTFYPTHIHTDATPNYHQP